MKSLVLVAAMAAAAFAMPQSASAASVLDCAQERAIQSQNSSTPTTITFRAVGENDETQFKIYWLDYNGKRVFYKHIFAGDVYRQPTYLTHPWLVTAPEPGGGEWCIAIYVPGASGNVITLD